MAADPQIQRSAIEVTAGMAASDGAGVRMTRMIGTPRLDMVDPFLLFDVFRSDDPDDYIAGFPSHPHRGFETVTYMFAGRMRHRDNAGHEGVIGPGGVQWMTAGRGIIHSEMPEQDDGLMWGTQLWINLPAGDKLCTPGYQEFPAERLPAEERAGGVRVVVVAGTTSAGTRGAVTGRPTDPIYFDVSLPADADFDESVPDMHNGFVFVIGGRIGIDGRVVEPGQLAILGDGSAVRLRGMAPDSRLLLVAARALKEPVARGGPFVMNTQDELRQAFYDYQAGRF